MWLVLGHLSQPRSSHPPPTPTNPFCVHLTVCLLCRRYGASLHSLAHEEDALRRVDPLGGRRGPHRGVGMAPSEDGAEPSGRMLLAEIALSCRGAVSRAHTNPFPWLLLIECVILCVREESCLVLLLLLAKFAAVAIAL